MMTGTLDCRISCIRVDTKDEGLWGSERGYRLLICALCSSFGLQVAWFDCLYQHALYPLIP